MEKSLKISNQIVVKTLIEIMSIKFNQTTRRSFPMLQSLIALKCFSKSKFATAWNDPAAEEKFDAIKNIFKLWFFLKLAVASNIKITEHKPDSDEIADEHGQ